MLRTTANYMAKEYNTISPSLGTSHPILYAFTFSADKESTIIIWEVCRVIGKLKELMNERKN